MRDGLFPRALCAPPHPRRLCHERQTAGHDADGDWQQDGTPAKWSVLDLSCCLNV